MKTNRKWGVLIKRAGNDEEKLRGIIVDAIRENGSVNAAAKELGVSHNTLTYWQKRLDIHMTLCVE